jgi:dihydroorotate dehydrogenase
MSFYENIVRSLAFKADAETAHRMAVSALKFAQGMPPLRHLISACYEESDPALQFNLLGMRFENPIGLAAGFDKDCELYQILPCFGFGFVECGTVTARAQEGNPLPRLFRVPEQQALVNRMGFNNKGAHALGKLLEESPAPRVPVGINLGKSKLIPIEMAAHDYLYSMEKLFPFADYIVVNVSSPNTPRLRELQRDLEPLLKTLQDKNRILSGGKPKPLFVKIAPDLTFPEIDNILVCCFNANIAGIIATNTTISREGVPADAPREGGLSGRPLRTKSTEILRHLYQNVRQRMVLIGVGGVFTAEDAYEKIRSGASLVQLYTGWIYGGPGAAARINRGLVQLLRRDGFKNAQDAVGADL